ncbi:hypothetical protein [Geminicoccus flavidas]|uniref:hypothetical protein n=1 Tax=Geminicoccus flavidas TaxID=2506407 RepID=UPI001357092D|nr:hypothetical protein [Geminicoccus flavidas]
MIDMPPVQRYQLKAIQQLRTLNSRAQRMLNPTSQPGRATAAIFAVGTAGAKQAAQRADGQWFYRVKQKVWRRWLPCEGRPDHAWYDPRAGRARLPEN